MFTGIVEEVGVVEAIAPSAGGRRLVVRARTVLEGTEPGASVAVNGVCVTVVRREAGAGIFEADLLGRTWEVTALRFLAPGSGVNLERALRVGDRIGGHFVLGHVDGTGVIGSRRGEGADVIFRIDADPSLAPGFVPRGSVAVDGVSLTIARVFGASFEVHCIPHTLLHTTLGALRAGAAVNLETDVLGKYARPLGGVTEGLLRESGF